MTGSKPVTHMNVPSPDRDDQPARNGARRPRTDPVASGQAVPSQWCARATHPGPASASGSACGLAGGGERAGTATRCPVCREAAAAPLLSIEGRDYWRCPECGARFLDPCHHPSAADESAHYLHHENDPADPRYRGFLERLADPLITRLPVRSSGLDYGCGPGPALAAMLREAGHDIALFDPFFRPDRSVLERRYDFVTCTETAEHFHRPAEEFDRLMALVRPGGWLAVMTCFQTDDARFATWHYRKDPTHVVFYREETLRHLAARRGWSCEIPVKDVALMQKPCGDGAAA